jgi:hypothetical protein
MGQSEEGISQASEPSELSQRQLAKASLEHGAYLTPSERAPGRPKKPAGAIETL